MKILVVNAGSSSLKYQIFDMENESVIAKGNCEKIGINGSFIKYKANGVEKVFEGNLENHTVALSKVLAALVNPEYGVVKSLDEIDAVGHRIVHGGEIFKQSVLITEENLKVMEELIPLAPLHMPANISGVKACQEIFGNKPQVAVFDTAFHSNMPAQAFLYGIPYECYADWKIRRYGFHGTSHRYVSARCAELMGKDIKDLKIISCHIGNGSSITAIDGGKVIDTTMGLTPLDGFIMGTRTGTLDPSVVTFIAEKENLTPSQLSDLFNKKSGLLGISGISSDDRDVLKAAREGNDRAILAHELLVYQIQKYIGSYIVALGGVDAIIFTAGLGENQYMHREKIIDGLSFMGIKLDHEKNDGLQSVEALISEPDSKAAVWVIPTNEELVIARDTKALVEKL